MDSSSLQSELLRFDPAAPIESARTPPACWYTRADALALEKSHVFQQSWQFVGRREQLKVPGDYFSGIFLGWPYLVTLDEQHKLQAFYNVCSHHGTCVADGQGRSNSFDCPYHGWKVKAKVEKTIVQGEIRFEA